MYNTMRISGMNFGPYQMKLVSSREKKETTTQAENESVNVQNSKSETVQTSKSLTSAEKAENFKSYILNKYKDYGLTFSSGLTAPKSGVAPSISVDPRLVEQAANDPEKAKEVDEMIYAATMIDTNFFNAMNHPPEVTVSFSTHINADGTSVGLLDRRYNSLKAKNKYGGFDANSFLDQQEELLKKHKSDFDYNEATGAKSSEKRSEKNLETRREEKKWLREFRNELQTQEWIDGQREQRYLLYQQQQKQFLDQKV